MSHDASMSSAGLWSWPSATPQHLSPANRLKGPEHLPPVLLPVDPTDSPCCTWYSSQTCTSLSSGKGSGAKIWIENTTLFVRIGMSPGMCAYRASVCLYQRDASGLAPDRALSGHLLQVTGTDETCTPGEQCKSVIVSRMKNSGCSRVAGNPDSFHKHGSHLQQTFPGEPNPPLSS